MGLPYASDTPLERVPKVTLALMGVHTSLLLSLMLGEQVAHWSLLPIFQRFGIVPGQFQPFTLATYFWLHAGLSHLLLNMFYLWVFGGGVETALGGRRFLLLYLLSGMVGGGLQAFVTARVLGGSPAELTPIVGASAACAGLVGLYAVRYYRARLEFALVPYHPHVVVVVGLFLAYEIGAGVLSLAQGSAEAGIAHWAHIGGFVFGLSCAQLLRLGDIGHSAYLDQDASRAMDRNVPGAAVKRYEALLAREPENISSRTRLAEAWLQLGDIEQASLHYGRGLEQHLHHNQRTEAAQLYLEIRSHDLPLPALPPAEQMILGNALEELEQFAQASEVLRLLATRSPEAPEAETALLKAISLYVHRLARHEEARILLSQFQQRYPRSAWRSLAEDLSRIVTKHDP